jgi:hypothetical protein
LGVPAGSLNDCRATAALMVRRAAIGPIAPAAPIVETETTAAHVVTSGPGRRALTIHPTRREPTKPFELGPKPFR